MDYSFETQFEPQFEPPTEASVPKALPSMSDAMTSDIMPTPPERGIGWPWIALISALVLTIVVLTYLLLTRSSASASTSAEAAHWRTVMECAEGDSPASCKQRIADRFLTSIV